MRAAGPLPVAVPISAGDYLAHRRDLLQRWFGEIEAKAALNALDDIRIKGGDRKITPLKAITPEAAEDALIVAQWYDVLRLATSVRTGAVSASLMLKRLRAYLGQNGLALASREIGRIERTLHALDWLERPALRRQATAELNKGESHNALARAVCFLRLGRLHDRTAQAHRASGLALVTAAIIPWNTVYSPTTRGPEKPEPKIPSATVVPKGLEFFGSSSCMSISRPRARCRQPWRRHHAGCATRTPRSTRMAAHQRD